MAGAFEAVDALIDAGIFPETILGHNCRSHYSNSFPTVRSLQGRPLEPSQGKEDMDVFSLFTQERNSVL